MKVHRTYLEWIWWFANKVHGEGVPMTQILNLHRYRNSSYHGSFHDYDQINHSWIHLQMTKKTYVILIARTSPFRNYRISKDYRNPSYIRSFHNYDQINHNWIHLRMAENTSHHVNCTDVTLPQLWISTDYRNPSYHGSFHNYDHYEWPKRTLII